MLVHNDLHRRAILSYLSSVQVLRRQLVYISVSLSLNALTYRYLKCLLCIHHGINVKIQNSSSLPSVLQTSHRRIYWTKPTERRRAAFQLSGFRFISPSMFQPIYFNHYIILRSSSGKLQEMIKYEVSMNNYLLYTSALALHWQCGVCGGWK